MKKLKLNYYCMLKEKYPLYKDNENFLWCDLNPKNIKYPRYRLYNFFDEDYDDWELNLQDRQTPTDIYGDVEVTITSDFERSKNIRQIYMILSSLENDVFYFLGNGSGCVRYLWNENIEDHIDKMKECYKSLPLNKKPEWISLEDIENYRKKMINFSID